MDSNMHMDLVLLYTIHLGFFLLLFVAMASNLCC